MKEPTASKIIENALEKAHVTASYSEQYAKIKIIDEFMETLEALPKYARAGASPGTQDAELLAECVRFVALNGYGRNVIADAICREFLEAL